jgi:hypothetical protein
MSRRTDENSLKQTHALEDIACRLRDIYGTQSMDSPWPSMCIPKPPSKVTHALLPDGWHEVNQLPNGYSQISGSHGLFVFTDVNGEQHEGPTSSLLAIKVERGVST